MQIIDLIEYNKIDGLKTQFSYTTKNNSIPKDKVRSQSPSYPPTSLILPLPQCREQKSEFCSIFNYPLIFI